MKQHIDALYEELYIDGDLLILYDKNEQIKTINLKNGNEINFDKTGCKTFFKKRLNQQNA